MSFRRSIFRHGYTVSLFVLMLSGSAYAASLEEAARQSLQTHPSIEAAKAVLDSTRETKSEARAGYFPDIALGAAAGRIYGDNATSRGLSVTRGAGYSYYGEGTASMSQMLFDGFETPRRVAAANARMNAANASVDDISESLALRAVQSYIDLLRARKGLAMVQGYGSQIDDYLARIADMVEQGASDEVELQQARDVSIILKAINAEYAAQVRAAEARYSEVTGVAPPEDMSEPQDRSSSVENDPAAAIAFAKDTHPALRAAMMQAEAAEYDISAEQATLYPDVNGELSYLKSDKDDVLGGEVIDGRALVRMSWGFSTGGEQLARIRRSKYTKAESQARQAELERQIEQNIRLAYSEYSNASQQMQLLLERRDLNEKLFGAYETQFEGARVNLLQLMQAHNQLFNTQLEVNNGYYRLMNAQYAVLASSGKLREALNAPVQVNAPQGTDLPHE